MEQQKVDMYLMANSQYLPAESMHIVQQALLDLPEDKAAIIHSIEMKNPTTLLLISIFLGEFGVDRFMLGDTGLGVGKLLTFGGCLVWWFIDLFLIMGRTREVNFQNLMGVVTQFTNAANSAGQFDGQLLQ